MRNPLRALVTWLTVGALLVTSPAWAQQHVVDSTLLQQAIAEQRALDDVNRQMIERVLVRPDVQAVAARMGVDIKDARTAIAGISGDELAAIASTAKAVDLAGGQGPTVTISLVVLLLVIIIVILLAD
jgi:sugar diacid utilization regulator